jgi:protein-S-isoprenylcysteine O-methyltransferase Ste14
MLPFIPINLPWLAPFHDYAPLLWLAGVVCLGLTRFTHQLARRWGGLYYVFSALIRPLGILLTLAGWMALNSGRAAFSLFDADAEGFLFYFGWDKQAGPQAMFWVNILTAVGLLAAFALGLWSILVLGVRRSLFYRKADEGLVTRGPYRLVRHPQFLSAIGIAFFSSVLFPAGQWATGVGQTWIFTESFANWVMFTIALWVLSIIEDRELEKHFGEEYRQYCGCVPRIFPN